MGEAAEALLRKIDAQVEKLVTHLGSNELLLLMCGSGDIHRWQQLKQKFEAASAADSIANRAARLKLGDALQRAEAAFKSGFGIFAFGGAELKSRLGLSSPVATGLP